MFAEGVATAAEYTRPVIVSKRLQNQEVTGSMGTFVVVNDSGWILTAAHILQDMLLAQQHMQERDQYQKAVDAINANTNFSIGKKKHEINQLKRNWQWVVNCSAWWAVDGLQYRTARIDLVADLAIAQLTGPIETLGVKKFPSLSEHNQADGLSR
jgi:hypothetical protein